MGVHFAYKKIGLAAVIGLAAAVSWPTLPTSVAESPILKVVFEDPVPTGPPKLSDEECTTSCSLKKHPIPKFDYEDYRQALADYTKRPARDGGEALDQLLFHGSHTEDLIDVYGVGELPEEHKLYLSEQLSRRNAVVSLRMVEPDGTVRVSYGPMKVPLGQKQHLSPMGENLQAMEFNGTVMRTGVNYLWSRY